ncbi:winged helix-turn-helix domain-containing protein [Bradyrhizobium xenonodulans]|uniref:Winged helix-turn-helix domain-containing protein n=1 Tax=Bradyrhizobium xenonodulans TaxID=2736875 RepID=A0ABY7MEL2_9BRAD|nr:winged helix-turn-helix domain-containing protein [Bradyrhizobium xenonodulans]WBL75340.1 winged helix-turn-helix domain-containing protein [Bradyrhizobium xenonodulans]
MAAILEFGPFRLDVDAGILFRGAEPTPLGQRAVLLLALLVRRAGTPVSKDALIEAAWPAQAIEDSNLTVQIAAVRRTLADASGEAQWIETLPRRGYRYVGPAVTASDPDRESAPSLTLPERPSIAVLPFANLSGDAEQDYFADGMVDDIITGLSRINWLFVIARNSTFTYKGRAVDVKQVGRELGVRYVLEGSVRKASGNVRITGQLIDASTGMHVWAERYDRQSDDIFGLQDDIAMSVVGAIAPSLRRAEINRVKRKRPDSLDAYDLVLRAQPDVDSGMPEQVTQALVLLERAIALEPSYALAHGNAAMCHHCLFLRAGLQEASRADSIRHARSAIAHGQDDAVALTLAGFSIGMDGHDRSSAFTALDAALAISPSSALTYILGSVMLGWGGDADRAIEWSERGMRLSPFDSWAFAAFDAQAMGHFHHGRYEEACRAAYRSVQANPRHSITHVQLAAALAKLGRLQEARTAAARVLELHPTFRYGRQFQGVNCAPALAASLGEALRAAGLPE